MVRTYEARHGNDYSHFARENIIQLNDTHPVFAIPELIRVLEGKGVSYRLAFSIARKVFNYTNHTICRRRSNAGINGFCRGFCPILHGFSLN